MSTLRFHRIAVTALMALAMVRSEPSARAMPQADFSRYEVILTRRPFGEPPAPPATPTPPAAETPPAPPFTKDLRMCAITEDDTGIRVGIVDISAKPQPKSYLFRLGEEIDEITLVDADYKKEGALLRKGDEELWIYMSSAPSAEGTAAKPPPPRPAAVVGGRPVPPGGGVFPMPASGNPGTFAERFEAMAAHPPGESYLERLKKRREAERVRIVESPTNRLSPEELEKHLKEYQMELIRAGGEKGPPLPIPLTKEMDDQLVQEGVLPPLDQAQTAVPEQPVVAPPPVQ